MIGFSKKRLGFLLILGLRNTVFNAESIVFLRQCFFTKNNSLGGVSAIAIFPVVSQFASNENIYFFRCLSQEQLSVLQLMWLWIILNVIYQPSRNLFSLISAGRTKYSDIYLESADGDWGDVLFMIILVLSG